MNKTYYHSTIKFKLDQILAVGAINPGSECIEMEPGVTEEAEMWGLYDNYSHDHVYAWTNKRSALECARSLSRNARKDRYSLEERVPVVIPIIVDKRRVSVDPDCGSSGVMILGEVDTFNTPIIL